MFKLYNSLISRGFDYILFYKGERRDINKLSNLSKIVQQGSGQGWTQTQICLIPEAVLLTILSKDLFK